MSASLASKIFEFWLGRAGSGKTHACIESIARIASDQPRGPMLLWLVPEQATAQAEYELAAQSGLAGYTRARVVSFDYLRRESFRRLGGRPKDVIDETARVMLLRQVIRSRREVLRVLGSSANLPGLAESVSAALTEFQRYGWKRDDLRASREEIHSRLAVRRGENVSLLEWKLADLEAVWSAYDEELLARGLHDGASLGPLAAEKIAQWDELEGARLWIDGFASFTAEETRLLEALLGRCEAAAMTLCLDPSDKTFVSRERAAVEPNRGRAARLEMVLGPTTRIGAERVFENLERTFFELRDRLMELGWRVGQIDFPREGQAATRFSESSVLGHLESRVLTRLRAEPVVERVWQDERARFDLWPPGPVELIEADQAATEIEAVARRIAALGAGGMRWREIAVLSRGLDAYAPLVREIFPRYGIPFFLDARRELACHPVARLLVAALEIASRDWHTDAVKRFLKSGLSPLDDRDVIARIERLADRCRLRSADWFDAALWKEEGRHGTRGRVPILDSAMFNAWTMTAAPLRQLRRDLATAGFDPAEALWRFLSDCGAGARLAKWIAEARAQGDEETALLHGEAWREVVELLERIHQIGLASVRASEQAFVAGELLEIVEAGLATVRAALVPPTLDQVLIGAVDRTRTPPVRAAFVLGMNDGEFPRLCEEDPFFGDREREDLACGGRTLGPNSRRRFDHERFLAYIALTRASEYVCVSRTAASGGASSHFHLLAESLPMISPQVVPGEMTGEVSPTSPMLAEAWARDIAGAVHRAEHGEDPSPLAHALATPHLLDLDLWGHIQNRPTLERVRATILSLKSPELAALDPQLAPEFWSLRPELSVTGLETYACCPYKFFAERMLRLERPPDPLPGPPALGTLRHDILERLFQRFNHDGRLDWGEIDVREAQRCVEVFARELVESDLAGEFGRDELTRRITSLAVEELKLFVLALHTMGRRYGFDQFKAEFRIQSSSHPLSIEVAPGLSIKLTGTIDRVDAVRDLSGGKWMLLFDYKSTKSKVDLARLWDGSELQLPAYALAMQSLGSDWKVAGFFYWPMNVRLEEAKGGSDEWAEPGTPEWFKRHRPAGLFVDTIYSKFDREAAPKAPPLAFSFEVKNDGTLNVRGSWLSEEDMNVLLERTLDTIRYRTARIIQGEIGQSPILQASKSECDYCDHAARCRIADAAPRTGRSIESIKSSSELRERIKAVKGNA